MKGEKCEWELTIYVLAWQEGGKLSFPEYLVFGLIHVYSTVDPLRLSLESGKYRTG